MTKCNISKVSRGAETANAAAPFTTESATTGAATTDEAGSGRLSSRECAQRSSESVDDAYSRLVLNAPSLLPRCEMPVARLVFAEWLLEQEALEAADEK